MRILSINHLRFVNPWLDHLWADLSRWIRPSFINILMLTKVHQCFDVKVWYYFGHFFPIFQLILNWLRWRYLNPDWMVTGETWRHTCVRPQMESRFSGWKIWLKNNPGLVKSSPWHPRKIGRLHHINSNINFQPKTGNVKGSWPIITGNILPKNLDLAWAEITLESKFISFIWQNINLCR